ncbi:MAG: RIP metalloprotease RseP, partial [Gallionella sp.]|nr:RIP metalloprotease RseP [Gallionella sp.]
MITLLAFIGAISLLVVFHELGHYLVARRYGVKVLRFSLGFGQVIYSKRFANNDTEWVISAFPLGGYVKMVDEREGEVAPEDVQYAFNRKPVLQRMAIVVAGPLANFLLAILLYWALFIYGVPGLKPVLGDVPPGTPAAIAEMQAGETIVSIDGEPVPSWHELRWMLLEQTLRQDSGQGAQRHELKIEVEKASGTRLIRLLDIGTLEPKDLDGEFLDKLGLHPYQPPILPVIGKVIEGSVAQLAGLREGDVITRADGATMAYWINVVEVIRAHPGQTVRLEIQRGETTLNVSLVPQASTESGRKIGLIGVAP